MFLHLGPAQQLGRPLRALRIAQPHDELSAGLADDRAGRVLAVGIAKLADRLERDHARRAELAPFREQGEQP